MKKDPDALIRKVREGDEIAFSELCDMYRSLINRAAEQYSSGIVPEEGNVQDDFRQEAILALYRAANTFKLDQDKVTFGLYAKTCIRNALITLIRKAKSRPKTLPEEIGNDQPTSGDPADRLLSIEMINALSAKFAEVLTSYEREVFVRYLEGEKPREIARSIGKDAKSVSNAIFRARTKVRPILPERR